MLTLNLALITYGPDGLKRVGLMHLPKVENTKYIISWQASGNAEVPVTLLRDDIEIFRTDSRGAAINRNNAIAHCTGDIILFSDDDLIYTSEQIGKVLEVFEQNPDVDVATFEATHPCNPLYPKEHCKLTEPLPKGYWVSAYQIAYRRMRVGNLLCHPMFGAGAPLLTGADDELFLLSAIRRGLNCQFFPINICTHPQLSTGTTENLSPGNLRAIGCYIYIAYPKTFAPRLLLKAWRIYRNRQSNFFRAIWHLCRGASLAPGILKGDRRYLW